MNLNKKTTEGCEAFNNLYPIGTPLILKDDFGNEIIRKLKSKAWIVGNNSVIALFEGLIGGYDITRVKQRMRMKNNISLGISYLVPADANGNELIMK